MLLAVANKVSNVHKGAIEIGPNGAPVADSRGYNDAESGVSIRCNNILVARPRIVIPGNSDHFFGKNGEQLRIFNRNISPKHKLLVIRLHDLENFLKMFEINTAESLLGG